MLIVPGIRKLGFAVLATAILCCTISHLSAADPSVEVFTDERTVTTAGGRDISFLPQLPFRWSLTVNGGYDDNVNTTPEAAGSAFTQTNLTLSKDLRTARTQLSMIVSGGVVYYFTAEERARFSNPDAGQFSNVGRNFFRGPTFENLNVTASKRTHLVGRQYLEFRLDATNVLNKPSFGFPTNTLTTATFGRIFNSVASSARQVQLGIKYAF